MPSRRIRDLVCLPSSDSKSDMRASPVFILHLLGFGLLVASIAGGFLLDRTIRKETDVKLRLFAGHISRKLGLLSPFAALILLITGIANIQNMFVNSSKSWYEEGWLVAKVILYGVMLLNGTLYGPKLSRARMRFLESLSKDPGVAGTGDPLKSHNRQITLFYIVQTLLLLLILIVSVTGTGKHPGIL